MKDSDKRKIYNTAKKRTERDKLLNKGVEIPFGQTNVTLTALDWDSSNVFEDSIVELSKKFSFLTGSDIMKTGIDTLIETAVDILRNDLVKLANVATNGKVDIDYIKEVKATKNDVITVVIEAFKLNYSYLKNLMTLAQNQGLK